MLSHLRPALVVLVGFSLLLGLAYPLAVTGVAQLLFPYQANGSLETRDGRVIGSALIGQSFASDRYFHGRPSATVDADPADPARTVPAPYNAAASGGSNLGPTNQALIDRVRQDAGRLRAQGPGAIPADLVAASASGLDPDVTPAAALFQVPRVARARGLPEERVRQLVLAQVQDRTLGLIGEPHVNVLQLNLALDRLAAR